ncbi:MAG TPA: hypothetical protein VGX03_14195 [Candidatus Binatia bacterium]|nr:hypothetical protein [Candidatus Binatia bacterium]
MSRRWAWTTASFAILVAVVVAASLLIDEPLRRILERRLNANLQGYTARLGAADFHPLGFALDLKDLVIVQDANPEPPVISILKLSASVHGICAQPPSHRPAKLNYSRGPTYLHPYRAEYCEGEEGGTENRPGGAEGQ